MTINYELPSSTVQMVGFLLGFVSLNVDHGVISFNYNNLAQQTTYITN